jgi:hypothetical protein
MEIASVPAMKHANLSQETTHQVSNEITSVELLIRARPTNYELLFSTEDAESAQPKFTTLGQISSAALTHRRSGKESPNTGAHFAIYAQGSYDKPSLDLAHFEFAEWRAV